MIAIVKPKPALEEFLKLPETEPASEFIDGEILQKPMPQGEHSVLQGELCKTIDRSYQFRLRRNDIEDTAVPFPYN